MSEFGIKIKKISAGILYDVNLGVRDSFPYKDAMLTNSLFLTFIRKNGLTVYKGKKQKGSSDNESTRDLICLDFDFGSRSYEKELAHLQNRLDHDIPDEARQRIEQSIQKVKTNKHLYSEKKRGEIRDLFYNEGVTITYQSPDHGSAASDGETIHYKMLYRTSAKAKLGQAIFIKDTLYNLAHDWLTMGLGKKMQYHNAKIVEMSAYAPLTTSTIIGTMHIPVRDVLILNDQDSFFRTYANIVKAQKYIDKKGNEKKKCIVCQEETEVKNTIWDGMGIIESGLLPEWVNGMALLRNHLFKMCGIRGYIQTFFKDWCKETGNDYDTYQVQDMFGRWHYVKDIKMITTDNAVKWKKFTDLTGGTLESAYDHWCGRIHADGDIWGIVKTDHESKYGDLQQLSYQMINTLPCTKEDVKKIAQTSMDYVERLKTDPDEFELFLRKNANEINHYHMLADLYDQNHEFGSSKWFREEKKKIISAYVSRLRKGKVLVNGDNLTVFGNPYALLLYAVGANWQNDPTLHKENGCIQCFTNRFPDGKYLAAFRNPHNAPNNICYMHNVYSEPLQKYFAFSPNIAAINCIGSDIQDRANGMDEDSDFMLFTDHPTIVSCARTCYNEYPTIVNALQESGITYHNTMTDYSTMDNRFAGSKMGIGWSSNLAQLAMTYYWTEKSREQPDDQKLQELYDNFIILSVLAQIIIDGCKREYEINAEDEIKRISKLPCMSLKRKTADPDGTVRYLKWDYPLFMKYTKEIKYTKNGKELPHEEIQEKRDRLKARINDNLHCPMNWLEEWLDKIKGASTSDTIPTEHFFLKMNGKPNNRQMTKIRRLIENYAIFTKTIHITESDEDQIADKLTAESDQLLTELKKIKIGNIVTINRLIETSLGLESGVGASKKLAGVHTRYTRKMLNYLYKMDKNKFLVHFKSVPS